MFTAQTFGGGGEGGRFCEMVSTDESNAGRLVQILFPVLISLPPHHPEKKPKKKKKKKKKKENTP